MIHLPHARLKVTLAGCLECALFKQYESGGVKPVFKIPGPLKPFFLDTPTFTGLNKFTVLMVGRL
jgi:hypothetical protein